MSITEEAKPVIDWPCACVRRDRSGNMTHIKINAARVKQCRKCGSKRPRFPLYRCVHCGLVTERQSSKKWIKSQCDTEGREVRLQRVSEGTWSYQIQEAKP